MTSAVGSEASEVAVVMASLVPALPLQTRTDLKRMLDAELTVPSAACVRQQRLGLLLD